MGDSTPRGPPIEPAIHEVSIEEGGVPRAIEAPAPAGRPWLVAIVIAAAVAGLAYGFLLGRGDRAGPTVASEVITTTTTSTPPATTAITSLDPFPQSAMPFVRAAPGHDLGRRVTEYLNPNRYEALAIDDDGIVWAGGPSGVVRLDPGTGSFTKLTTSDGTGPLGIIALATGPDGTVFAASTDGLSRWDGEGWTHDSRFPSTYPTERWVRALETGPSGEVWLATTWWMPEAQGTGYIHRLEDPYAGDMPAFSTEYEMAAMDLAEDGTLYLQYGARLWRYDGEWHEAATLPPYWSEAMAIDEAGNVWLAGENQIYRWDGSDLIVVPWESPPSETEDGEPVSGWRVTTFAAGPSGGMWALAHNWGLYLETEGWTLVRFDGDSRTSVAVPSSTWPRALAVAPDGAVWIANGDELLRFDGGWQTYSMEEELPLRSSQSLAIGAAGDLWVASSGGLLRGDGEEWRLLGLDDLGLAGDDSPGEFWVTAGPEGSIWAGAGCHAFRLVDEEWTGLPETPDAPPSCYHVRTTVDPGGALWIIPGHYDAPLTPVYRWSGEEWELIMRTRDQADIAFGDDGEVWMVHEQGIGRLVDGERRPLLEGVFVSEIAVSADGNVWATGGRWDEQGGLWRYDGDTWSLTRPGTTIHSLTRGPDGRVWGLITRPDGGTDLIDLERGHIRFVAEGPLEGGLAIAPDGVAWIGGEGRLYRVTPLDEISLTAVQWRIELDDWGPGIHTVHMLVDAGPLVVEQVADAYGHLVWEDTLVELCAIGIDDLGSGVMAGDIFQTTEGCGADPTAMQDAFDAFGLPDEACLFVDVDGLQQPLSYCASLGAGPSTP